MILLIGAGYMAQEYAKILKSMKLDFIVVGRSEETARNFEKKIGVPVIRSGLPQWLKTKTSMPASAIVAVDEENLGSITRQLITLGVKKILVEKPGGVDAADLAETNKLAIKNKAGVFIAYNRRFYSSVLKAREIIKKDGGILSFNFDFSERSYLIKDLKKPKIVKINWILMNSSHVIDMAFYLGGKPKLINGWISGEKTLAWHPQGSIYVGWGIANKNIPFTYHANWQSPGNWKIEILTPKSKLIFMPLEELKIQKIGIPVENVRLDNKLDIDFKPGLYKMVESFIKDGGSLPIIKDQLFSLKKVYNRIDSNKSWPFLRK